MTNPSGKTICLILAAVCFGLGAAGVPHLNWISAGLMFVVLSWLV